MLVDKTKGNSMAGIKDFLFGIPYSLNKVETMTPEQKNYSQYIRQQSMELAQDPNYQAGSSWLQNILSGSPESTKAFEQPYMNQFYQQTLPSIASRFAGMGSGNLSSSAFQQALGEAGQNLQTGLAAIRGGLQQNAATQALGYAQAPGQQLASLAGYGLSPEFAYMQKPATSGFIPELAGQAAGAFTGGLGAELGKGAASKISQWLQRASQQQSSQVAYGGPVSPSKSYSPSFMG